MARATSAGDVREFRILKSACRSICNREAGYRKCAQLVWMEVRMLSVVTRGLILPGTEEFGSRLSGYPTLRDFRRVGILMLRPHHRCCFYRFAWPRANFLTFGFFDPRGYSRGFSGLSALRFLRAVRLAFLRSSLLNFVVFAMNEWIRPFSLQIVFHAVRPYNSKSLRMVGNGHAIPSTRCRRSRTPGHLHSSATCAPLVPR